MRSRIDCNWPDFCITSLCVRFLPSYDITGELQSVVTEELEVYARFVNRISLKMWDEMAETSWKHLRPEDFVYVSGQLGSYAKASEGGQSRTYYEVTIDNIMTFGDQFVVWLLMLFAYHVINVKLDVRTGSYEKERNLSSSNFTSGIMVWFEWFSLSFSATLGTLCRNVHDPWHFFYHFTCLFLFRMSSIENLWSLLLLHIHVMTSNGRLFWESMCDW